MTASARSIAIAIDRAPLRVARRLAGAGAAWLVGTGRRRLPWRVDQRLRRFAGATSPRIRVFGKDASRGPRALLVSNDLSASGAPKVISEMAVTLIGEGWHVTVLSPLDGAFRTSLVAAGAVVIVDRSAEDAGSPTLAGLASAADILICNTIDTFAAVQALSRHLPTLWYIHEVSLLRHRLDTDPGVVRALALAKLVWAGSELPATILREVRQDITVVPYGLDPLGPAPDAGAGDAGRPLRIGIFGSYEPRKGQDLAVAAMALLPAGTRAQIRLTTYGRVLFEEFEAALRSAAAPFPEIEIAGELDPAGYAQALLGSDAVLVSSRDDTLPLVSLDALGSGRVLLCTATTGTSAWIDPGVSGFIATKPNAQAIAAMLAEAVARRGDWPTIGETGRAVFARAFSKTMFAAELDGAVKRLSGITPR